MVIFFEWHLAAVERKRSGLPMTGEDTSLEALASPLVGYLGKVQERAASLEQCPWCTSKGLTYALRSYRINLQESVTLCTNPQCLFPLVSRPLEDVLACLGPVETTVGNKRKNLLPLEKEELDHPPKRLRSSELCSLGTQSVTDTVISQTQLCSANTVSTGQHAAPKIDAEKTNGHCRDSDSPVKETTGWDLLQDDVVVREEEPGSAACTEGFAPPTCSASAGHLQSSSETLLTTDGDELALSPQTDAVGASETEDDFSKLKCPPEVLNRQHSLGPNQSNLTITDIYSNKINTPLCQLNEGTARVEQQSPTAHISTCTALVGIKSERDEMSSSSTFTESEELVSAPSQLFWRNRDNLCWLDSLLAALVKCKSLRRSKPRDEPQRSSVWQLMRRYEDICAAVQAHQQTGRDGVVMVPNHVLQKANADLQALRMSAFELLQPKLQCKLGQRETPVFAMPLLLKMDSWVEPLFQSTFHWDFKCSECKSASKERAVNTLPTFTNILPDWRPLHAVHSALCNVCCRKNQRRTMLVESMPPVFVLHFTEGLPDSDVRLFTFTFKGKHYSVTTVIQYNRQLKHFVTWLCNSDGSWLEYDDLKHPDCVTHQKLPIPAQEMHIVFWEAEEDQEPRMCSPTSTFSDSAPSINKSNPSLSSRNSAADESSALSPDQSLVMSHNDTDIVSALSVPEEDGNITDTTLTAGADTSIGSTTLFEAFQGLSHNDIVTLTLVEIKPDSEMEPVIDNKQTQDLIVPSETEMPDAAPDSSSNIFSNEVGHSPDTETPVATSEPESGDSSSSDPSFVPGARRRRGRGRGQVKERGTGRGSGAARGKTVGGNRGKKEASSNTAPQTSPAESSDTSDVTNNSPVDAAPQEDAPPVETTEKTSTSPQPPCQRSPPVAVTLDQNARWSFLLSKHPLSQIQKSITKPAPTHTPPVSVTQAKPIRCTHSTPNPVRKQPAPAALLPRPQLRIEGSNGLPMKAAEMYHAFGAKSSNTPSPLPSPITSHHQRSPTNTPVVSVLSTQKVKGLTDISSPKKQSSRSKALSGLSETEALRYKLMKKLKAKKKKLAKLNQLLGQHGGASLQPDSTDLGSPNTVTSSTYSSSTCDDFLSDLLSPATTCSNLSPDSTGFLEMLASRQDAVEQPEGGVNPVSMELQTNVTHTENFLEEFLTQASAQRPTEMETEALSALEFFI